MIRGAEGHLDLNMMPIPSGWIVMRDDRLKKSWSTAIDPFLISSYQVTNLCYTKVMGERHRTFNLPKQPVTEVSWLDAALFCNRLSEMASLEKRYNFSAQGTAVQIQRASTGFSLPTEAEWEFACRAGTNSPRYGDLDDIAWYDENSGGCPQEVGLKRCNNFGLYDMLGNVWEWCEDLYDPARYGTYRIFRGGGWADDARGCLATNRRRSHPTFQIDDVGFRIVRRLVV